MQRVSAITEKWGLLLPKLSQKRHGSQQYG